MIEQNKDSRECSMTIAVASQGVGKTVKNRKVICEYSKDNVETRVRGRKTLIFDSNGEYGTESFGKDGVPALQVKTLAVKDVSAWCKSDVVEVRRLNVKSLHMDEKFEILNYVIGVVCNCLFVIEDINKIVLEVTHLKRIVGTIVGLRHKACDVIVSYQALRDVPPRFLSNCKHLRLHYFSGDSDDVGGKLSEPEVFKIAQLIVNAKYYKTVDDFKKKKINQLEYLKRRSFFVYVGTDPHKIEGAFSKQEFIEACKKYLRINKKRVRDEMEFTGSSTDAAVNNQAEQLYDQYYGNP